MRINRIAADNWNATGVVLSDYNNNLTALSQRPITKIKLSQMMLCLFGFMSVVTNLKDNDVIAGKLTASLLPKTGTGLHLLTGRQLSN